VHFSGGKTHSSHLYLDVEKISLKRGSTTLKNEKIVFTGKPDVEVRTTMLNRINNILRHNLVAGIVTIVNEKRDIILYAVIKWDRREVCQYMENISGINPRLLYNGVRLGVVQDCMRRILKDNTLVGIDLLNDLKSLLYSHDSINCEDLQEYFRDRNNQPYGLKTLVRELLGDKTFQEGTHSSIQDARMTQRIHVKKLEFQSSDPFKSNVKIFDFVRGSVNFSPGDKCHCT
jgi:hypothetical protein